MAYQLICVDGDSDRLAATADHLRTELSDMAVSVATAETAAAARELLSMETAAVITEHDLPDGTGIDLIAQVRETAPDAGCILYTDADPERIDTTALQGAVTEYVGRNSVFGDERLAQLLRTTIEDRTQRSYPLPQDEDERLASLAAYDLEDETLQTSLDRIADLAATHFDVPRASVNIITEHSQEFLACYGDAADWETMDREDSVCTFTILEDSDVMVVEDVTMDPRFETHSESLIAKGIRAYMGASLVTDTGLVIGTLCIYDEEVRSFTAADRAYLTDLAAVAMDLIEAHTQAAESDHPAVSQ